MLYTKFKWRQGSGLGRVDAFTAKLLPALRLPTMPEPARQALQAVIRYEEIEVDRSLNDILRLAEARGFAAHPSDWLPHPESAPPDYPELYQPWAEWLAIESYTPYGEAFPLTIDSLKCFKPRARERAFRRLYQKDRLAAYRLLKQSTKTYPAEVRLSLLRNIGGGGAFYGNYPSDVPILVHFVEDKSPKIRDFATQRLKLMAGFETLESHIHHLVRHLDIRDGSIAVRPNSPHLFRHFRCVTLEPLAEALNLTPIQFATRCDITNTDFWFLILWSEDVAVRSIYAERRLDSGNEITAYLVRGVSRELWERGLRATLQSEYLFSVNDFLGPEIGTLDSIVMREHRAYKHLKHSIFREIETGQLPVNKHYDELRVLGLALNKEAAAQIMQEAISYGMAADNPRLTMLKLNLAL